MIPNALDGQDVFYKLQQKIKFAEKDKQKIIDTAISLIGIKYNNKKLSNFEKIILFSLTIL